MEWSLPYLEQGGDLIDSLDEVGWHQNGKALTWLELESWQRQTGVELTPWEATAIHGLSAHFVEWLHQSVDVSSQPPIAVESEQDRASRVQEKFFR